MKILLFACADLFEDGSDTRRQLVLEWIAAFARFLEQRGHQVGKFRPLHDRVMEWDRIHFFSSVENETWAGLGRIGKRVLLTPGLGEAPVATPAGRRVLERVPLRLLRALLQRKWPPTDETAALRSAEMYLPLGSEWARYLRREWGVDSHRLCMLPSIPEAAAEVADRIYRSP